MNANEYATVVKTICSEKGIRPDDTLIRNVTMYCKSLNLKTFKTKYPVMEQRLTAIAASYINSVQANQAQVFDYQEYLQKEHKRASTPANNDYATEALTNWIGSRMPVISSKAMSVYIDTRVRNVNNNSIDPLTDFTFILVPRQTRAELGDGRLQVRVMPSQITYFKVGRIILPYNETLRSRNYSNELTLTFTALRSNGIIAHNDTYHFAFTYQISATNPELIELTPVNEYCKFSPPLRLVDDLTLRFNDPLFPISFPVDRMRPTLFDYLTTGGHITFAVPHNLSSGDVVIVNGLTTHDQAANASLLNTINDPRGIIITRVNAYIIGIDVDFTEIASPDVTSLPWIMFYHRMFRFPLEIGYQDVTDL